MVKQGGLRKLENGSDGVDIITHFCRSKSSRSNWQHEPGRSRCGLRQTISGNRSQSHRHPPIRQTAFPFRYCWRRGSTRVFRRTAPRRCSENYGGTWGPSCAYRQFAISSGVCSQHAGRSGLPVMPWPLRAYHTGRQHVFAIPRTGYFEGMGLNTSSENRAGYRAEDRIGRHDAG